jgi:hypothetical protein
MISKFRAAAIGAIVMAGATSLAALPQSVSAQPTLTVQSEAAAHPRLVEAIHAMEGAYRDLQQAPDDFGGNKAQAMTDTRAAIHSLRKALFFRLKMDDAAIDRAQF